MRNPALHARAVDVEGYDGEQLVVAHLREPVLGAGLEEVAMDMWAPYIASTREHVPDADRKIVFDKFHIAQHLGRAVDPVRIAENRELVSEGDHRLKRTKFLWLTNPDPNSRSMRVAVLDVAGFADTR